MASLKEIKGRIASVKSTQKITSAMKLVASAKLRKIQSQVENFLPYQNRLMEILKDFLASETEFISPLAERREEIKAVAIVVFSSNSSLCGAFNSNAIRLFWEKSAEYKHLPKENIHIYPVGKKAEDTILKSGLLIQGSYIQLMDKPNFEGAKELADVLMKDFLEKRIDKVEIIYNHFKSTVVQVPVKEQFLPVLLSSGENKYGTTTDYLVEPDRKTILESLIPKSLRTKLYAILMDSATAEQAARTIAMQIATDNAQEILEDLTIQYNKQRQQSITSELLDIIGGSEALK